MKPFNPPLGRSRSKAATASRPDACQAKQLSFDYYGRAEDAPNASQRLDEVVSVIGPSLGVAADDDCRPAIELDQYYTAPHVAREFYEVFREHFDPRHFRMVEPSAGSGAFFSLLPPGSIGYDLDPRYPGVQRADFLAVDLPRDRPTAIIGNPPFGKNASMAVAFFNRAARAGDVIAFIMPASVRKASIENRLDNAFHRICEVPVPENAFLFRSEPFHVPAVFQIWERRPYKRELQRTETTHPDFKFTKPELADFAIQRVGANAGRVHHDLNMSPSSHYFIKGEVETIMKQLDFASVVGNVAGNPSLAKSEIVRLYREYKDGSTTD